MNSMVVHRSGGSSQPFANSTFLGTTKKKVCTLNIVAHYGMVLLTEHSYGSLFDHHLSLVQYYFPKKESSRRCTIHVKRFEGGFFFSLDFAEYLTIQILGRERALYPVSLHRYRVKSSYRLSTTRDFKQIDG